MYQSEGRDVRVQWTQRRFWTRAWASVAPNVWYLGITSLLTDVSSEMVASVLPVYLFLHLNLSPFAFGTIDGLYNGATAVTRWASGILSDRWRRHKEVAAVGYAMSSFSRVGLLVAGPTWTPLAVVIALDRLGKGIRTVPRDALISLSATPGDLAHSFGVHRALDAGGALLGPVVAFALLGLAPGGFDVVFVTSFCVAVIGLSVLMLFVENLPPATAETPAPEPSFRAAIGLLRERDFRVVVISAAGLALLTISDAFVYLMLHERVQFRAGLFPLLYVGTAMSYFLLAVPAGWLADRFGRPRMFLLGHGALLVVYGLLVLPTGYILNIFLSVVLLGAYYAATDGVVAALASGILPAGLRGSGLALLTTATSLSRLVASLTFGWIWATWNTETAIVVFALALGVGVTVAALALGRGKWNSNG